RHHAKPDVLCDVTNPLDQCVIVAGLYNLSAGGAGVVIGPHFKPGARLELHCYTRQAGPSLRFFARVVHAMEVPSFRPSWLTGCSVLDDPLPDDVLCFCQT